MSIRAQPPISCLDQVPLSPIARLPPPPGPFKPGYLSPTHHVYSSTTTHLLPQPSPFEPDCSSPTSTRPFRARLLVSHPTVSIRAQLLVSHLHQALLSPATCLPPNRVYSSTTARLPPPPDPFKPGYLSPTQPCLFEHNRSSPASTRPFRAWLLVSHPTVSIRAQLLMSHPPPGPFEPNHSSPTQPCPFERNCSCPTRSLCLLEHNCSPVIPWQLACCSAIHNLRTFL